MGNPTSFSDSVILEMLNDPEQRQAAIGALYLEAKLSVIKMVIKTGGQEDEALGILSEGLLVFLNNLSEGKFENRSTLKTYLIGICKFLWRDQMKKRAVCQKRHAEETEDVRVEAVVEQHLERQELQKLIQICLEQIPKTCRSIFQWRYFLAEPIPWEMIAEKLGYGNAQVARNRGQRCLKAMKDLFLKKTDLPDQIR